VIGSRSGRHGSPGLSAYCASKFGLIGLVESLAREVGGEGIRVNAVIPYGIDTPMAARTFEVLAARQGTTPEAVRSADEATIPLGRYAEPAEIAHACVWLASDLAVYVNGASIPVDGAAK
jgi:NAD(P)-dependent dehydrogenase (short-subunit alcohol dehydrogenase family)